MKITKNMFIANMKPNSLHRMLAELTIINHYNRINNTNVSMFSSISRLQLSTAFRQKEFSRLEKIVRRVEGDFVSLLSTNEQYLYTRVVFAQTPLPGELSSKSTCRLFQRKMVEGVA